MAEDWVSIGNYSARSRNTEGFIKQVGGFGRLIPDLNRAIEELMMADNRVMFRSRATSMPDGPLLGVDGGGKRLEILAIDSHEFQDRITARTYLGEDWSRALRQVDARAS